MKRASNAGPVPLILSVVALGVLVAVLGRAFFGLTSGPDEEVLTQVKKAESGFELPLPSGGTLTGAQVRFARITVHSEPGGTEAYAMGTLDFTGSYEAVPGGAAGKTKVSSLGMERIPFTGEGMDWKPSAGLAPQLLAIVDALERRRRALEAGDAAALTDLTFPTDAERDAHVTAALGPLENIAQRRFTVLAWYVRSEREEVEVAEEYRLVGTLPDRPVDEKAQSVLHLKPNGSGYFFSGPLR